MAFTNTRSAKWSRFWYSASALLFSLVTIAWLVYVYATSSNAKQLSKPIAGNNTTSTKFSCPNKAKRVAVIGKPTSKNITIRKILSASQVPGPEELPRPFIFTKLTPVY